MPALAGRTLNAQRPTLNAQVLRILERTSSTFGVRRWTFDVRRLAIKTPNAERRTPNIEVRACQLRHIALVRRRAFPTIRGMVKISGEYQGNLRCRAVHGPSGSVLFTDAPRDIGGGGEYPEPGVVRERFEGNHGHGNNRWGRQQGEYNHRAVTGTGWQSGKRGPKRR